MQSSGNNNSIMTLYHGSKSGISGAIAPLSRKYCDFGKGFYMGTERTQPLTLICNYPNAKMYTFQERQLCDIQGRLFELALKNGYDCPEFIRVFMNSQAAAALDDTYDRLQWAGEEYILEELDEESKGLKKAGISMKLPMPKQ